MTQNRTSEELDAWLRLVSEPGLGRASVRSLLAAIGLPQDILASSVRTLARHLPHDLAQRLASPPSSEVQAGIDTGHELLGKPDHHLITLADPQYPASLFEIPDPPVVLFVRGDPTLLHRPSVAIVGARSATEGGKDNARAFARYLAERGWGIVSGLARGIDAAAHEGALQAGPAGGRTIAVMAGGLDDIYPRQHQGLAEQVAAMGALVSEYPPGTPAVPFRFPDRNRLVAALARGVLVVEAAAQSGSLLTARLGIECGREVFAIPGSIRAPLSRGCHALIRQGAKLVEQGRDIEEELTRSGSVPGPEAAVPHTSGREGVERAEHVRHTGKAPTAGHAPPIGQAAPVPRSANRLMKDPTTGRVLAALGFDPAGVDLLCDRSGLAFPRVAAVLTELELNDIVQRLDDGRYVRRQHGIIYG